MGALRRKQGAPLRPRSAVPPRRSRRPCHHTRTLALALALAGCAAPAFAQLQQLQWPNTAFAPSSLARALSAPAVALAGSAPPASSFRWLGSVGLPPGAPAQAMRLGARTDGVLRVWVDDHALLDVNTSAPAPAESWSRTLFPMAPGERYAVRVEFANQRVGGAGNGTAVLLWSGNETAPAPVPPAAFSPDVAPLQALRYALRARLAEPRVPWQTWWWPNLAAHVHAASGLALSFGLGDAASGERLDATNVDRFSPWVRPGPHSANGSDYTLLNVSRWGGRSCTVLIESAVDEAAGDLIVLASASGADCAAVSLVLQPLFVWERVGAVGPGAAGNGSLACVPAGDGLNVTTVAAAGGAAVVIFPGLAAGSYLAQPLADCGEGARCAAFATGAAARLSLADVRAAVAAAAARQAATLAPFVAAGLDDAFAGAHSAVVWNAFFSSFEGVVVPINRLWDFGGGYVLFEWDTFLACKMMSVLALNPAEGGGAIGTPSGIVLDLALNTFAQMALGRTLLGHIPNDVGGLHISIELTEPYVAAQALRDIAQAFPGARTAWFVQLMWPIIFGSVDWAWAWRRSEGMLSGGPGAPSPLLCWGANAFQPSDDVLNLSPSLQVARYESGLDNSPMYDAPPVTFNESTGHMELYDAGATGLFVGELKALAGLAAVAGAPPAQVALLEARRAAAGAALNAHLWSDSVGAYVNVLFNGSAFARLSPTSFFPMLDGETPSASQVDALVALAASPAHFCLNSSHVGPAANLVQLHQLAGRSDSAACARDDCVRDQIVSGYAHLRVEALVLAADAKPPPGALPLVQWFSASRLDNALTTSETAGPDAAGNYVRVSREGWCWPAPPPPAGSGGGGSAAALTLWFSSARSDYLTCGSPACEAGAKAAGYEPQNGGAPLCFAFGVAGVVDLPCVYGMPSISRSDESFGDNSYWRGRSWGPHAQLVRWALTPFAEAGHAAAAATRAALAANGLRTFRASWRSFGFVHENSNSVLGVGADVGNSQAWYHWGALLATGALEESGLLA